MVSFRFLLFPNVDDGLQSRNFVDPMLFTGETIQQDWISSLSSNEIVLNLVEEKRNERRNFQFQLDYTVV